MNNADELKELAWANMRKEDEIDNWPIMGSEVPDRDPSMLTRVLLSDITANVIKQVRAKIRELGIEESPCFDEGNSVQFRFLTDTMLKYSRTPEQIGNMANGYLAFCYRESGQMRNPLLDSINRDYEYHLRPHVIDMSCFGPKKMSILEKNFGDAKFRSLKEHSRNPILETVSHGLAQGPIERYSQEPFYDGAYFIMSDPDFVDHDGIYRDKLIERKVPEDKRMTKDKLARLLQMPDLEKYILADHFMDGPSIGSNLAIIAEYFCEVDEAVYLNSNEVADIEKWIKGKFFRHNPPLEVAFYVWARFQHTEFEKAAEFIEGHILKRLKEDEPWIFEAVGKSKKANEQGSLFRILITAFKNLKNDPNHPNFQRLIQIIPGREICHIFTKSKNENYRAATEYYLKNLDLNLRHVTNDYSEERLRKNPQQMIIDILSEPDSSIQDWKVHEGFELLDPIAIAWFDKSIRSWGIATIRNNIFKSLDQYDLTGLFVFRNTVVAHISNPRIKTKLEELITTLIDKEYGEELSKGVRLEVLASMVRGEEVDQAKLIPAIKDLPPEMRRMPSAGRLPELAEKAFIASAFKHVRGGDEIVKFLMREKNRHSMNVVELIYPFPDAPNHEILQEYAESPNLLLFLSMSTILMYLGYSRDDIKETIHKLVEETENERRPELSTAGLEWEQVGGSVGAEIATDHFAELFNVLPQGGDTCCNEILSHPSTSAAAQNKLIEIITDPRHGYMNPDRMWSMQAKEGVPLSSLHLNVGVPKDLDISSTQIEGYLAPILRAAAVLRGGNAEDNYGLRGYARRWASGSLLDVLGDKHPGVKLEVRSTALEQDGSHSEEIDNLVMIASSCMQYAKDANGKSITSSGKIMAQIFDEFSKEVDRLKFAIDQAEEARRLLNSYARKIKAELGL
ncbi:MAG: hypothetical protein PHU71_01955 [Candidatus Gracilibacteria bacterium]|nr:hypothetical protein [Candidatus Gracilibacteria bacterium]